MIVIDRKAIGVQELAGLLAFLAELGHERAIVTREYLHSMVVGVRDEQETSMMVERQASRVGEQAIGIACLLGANRDLDSSISIKKRSIVCHRSSSNSQSAATTKDVYPRAQDTEIHERRWMIRLPRAMAMQQRDDERANEAATRTNQPTRRTMLSR